jgi:hypothetical protein
MATPRRIKRKEPEKEKEPDTFGIDDLPRLIEEYRNSSGLASAATMEANKFKEIMRGIIVNADMEDGEAYEDEKGSRYIDVDGVEGVRGIKHERRVSEQINTDKLIADLRKRFPDIDESEYIKTVPVFDEEGFMRLVWDKKVPASLLTKHTETKETFAFKVV